MFLTIGSEYINGADQALGSKKNTQERIGPLTRNVKVSTFFLLRSFCWDTRIPKGRWFLVSFKVMDARRAIWSINKKSISRDP